MLLYSSTLVVSDFTLLQPCNKYRHAYTTKPHTDKIFQALSQHCCEIVALPSLILHCVKGTEISCTHKTNVTEVTGTFFVNLQVENLCSNVVTMFF